MNILLSVEPDELGIVWLVLLILGIIVLVKFFQIAKDVRSIKEMINRIADSIVEEKDEDEITPTLQTQKIANSLKKTTKSDEENQDMIVAFINDCSKLYKRCNSKEEFESKVEEIIAKYNQIDNFDYSTLKSGLWEQFKQL